jgi:hypothetical protein
MGKQIVAACRPARRLTGRDGTLKREVNKGSKTMLKTTEVYPVSVVLNDGQALCALLLSKPNSLTLCAVAAVINAPADFGGALALAHDIAVPALGEKAAETAIIVAGTSVGTVKVETQSAYGMPQKRGPKKAAAVDPNAAVDSNASPVAPKRRGRKAKGATVAETPGEVNPTQSDVTA